MAGLGEGSEKKARRDDAEHALSVAERAFGATAVMLTGGHTNRLWACPVDFGAKTIRQAYGGNLITGHDLDIF
jgi:hypothetical protein